MQLGRSARTKAPSAARLARERASVTKPFAARPSSAVLFGMCAVFGFACRGAPSGVDDRLALPEVRVEAEDHAGSPLRGVLPAGAAKALSDDASAAFAVTTRVDYVERLPVETGAPVEPFGITIGIPIGQHARLILAGGGDEPVQATVGLADGVRSFQAADLERLTSAMSAGPAGPFGRVRRCAEDDTALAVGMTHRVVLETSAGTRAPRVGFEIAREPGTPDEASLALKFESFALDAGAGGPNAKRAVEQPSRELVLLTDTLDGTSGEIGFLVPSPFADGAASGFIVRIALARAPEPGPGGEAAVARHANLLRIALDRALATEGATLVRTARVGADEPRQMERERALQASTDAPHRRAALVYLAGVARADLCADLALTADEPTLAEFVALVTKPATENGNALDGEALAWHLERSAWSFLAARLDAEVPIAPALAGMLTRHAGEAGRSSGTIDDLLAVSHDARELARNLIEENRIDLEDSNPAARVRAFDWLAARGLEPKGFDPLAPAAERREALARTQIEEAPR